MDAGPFDDPLFTDFSGMGVPGTSTLLSAKAQADTRGNVHSIHVMLGLQHSDMMLGELQTEKKVNAFYYFFLFKSNCPLIFNRSSHHDELGHAQFQQDGQQ